MNKEKVFSLGDPRNETEKLKEYVVTYKGAVIVHAPNINKAIDIAWTQEAVRAEDIINVREN